jgi:hypothetical protein
LSSACVFSTDSYPRISSLSSLSKSDDFHKYDFLFVVICDRYIEPSIYLETLVRDFLLFGGKIVIRKFDTPRDLMSLPESIVVNCTGLGSKTLFNDNELEPIKGQFTICIPQPEVKYRSSGRVAGMTAGASINPRADGLLVGNMMERGVATLEPNDDVRKQNMEAAIQFVGAMKKA